MPSQAGQREENLADELWRTGPIKRALASKPSRGDPSGRPRGSWRQRAHNHARTLASRPRRTTPRGQALARTPQGCGTARADPGHNALLDNAQRAGPGGHLRASSREPALAAVGPARADVSGPTRPGRPYSTGQTPAGSPLTACPRGPRRADPDGKAAAGRPERTRRHALTPAGNPRRANPRGPPRAGRPSSGQTLAGRLFEGRTCWQADLDSEAR